MSAAAAAEQEACASDCVVRLHAPALDEFEPHRDGDRVVVMTGLSENAFATKWDIDGEGLRAAWDERVLSLGLKYTDGLSVTADSMEKHTLSDYLAEMRNPGASKMAERMIFDSASFFKTPGGKALKQQLDLRPFAQLKLETGIDGPMVLSLGGDRKGFSFHWHTEAWLELFTGKKHWWTAPPGTPFAYDLSSGAVTAAWIDAVLGGNRTAPPPPGVCAFTQLPGETVYLPEAFLHATMNEGAFVLGIGSQPGRPPWEYTSSFASKIYQLSNAANTRQKQCDPSKTGLLGQCATAGAEQVAEAARLAEAALTAFPECPLVALANARRMFWVDGDFAGALEEVERSLKLNALSLDATLLRAQLHKSAGDTKAADEAALAMLEKWRDAWRASEPYGGFDDTVRHILSKSGRKKWYRARYKTQH